MLSLLHLHSMVDVMNFCITNYSLQRYNKPHLELNQGGVVLVLCYYLIKVFEMGMIAISI